jgi:uncharacterized surface protein with fasciclin (FAS1) repeats
MVRGRARSVLIGPTPGCELHRKATGAGTGYLRPRLSKQIHLLNAGETGMASPKRMLKTALLAAPLGALALSLPAGSAEAADIVDTLEEQQQFSRLAKAIEAAGMAQALQGEGPYTVFAPTDQAFEQLPQEVQDALMKQENQDQLESLLHYHVVEGQAIMAEDALGKQTDVDTASGDRLSLDGTGQMIVLGPQEAAGGRQQSSQGPLRQGGVQAEVAEESGMPASEHQQQVLAEEPATDPQQTMAQEGEMPSSPHQEQVLRGEQEEQQTGQQAGTEQPQTAQGDDMPSSPHQEQVLATEPATDPAAEQQQTMVQEGEMPSSPHQEQVLRGQQGGQRGQGLLGEATVVEADIEADNGVIHAIDAVLVPQSVLSMIEQSAGRQGESGRSTTQRSTDKRG